MQRLFSLMRTGYYLALLAALVACGSGEQVSTEEQTAVQEAAQEVSKKEFALGGQVIGLKGNLVLVNDQSRQEITQNGSFRFANEVSVGQAYAVKIAQAPEGQSCFLQNNEGKISRSDANWVVVICVDNVVLKNKFTVKGNVSGLTGPIEIITRSGQNFAINQSGPYAFSFDAVQPVLPVSLKVNSADQTCQLREISSTDTPDQVYSVDINCVEALKDSSIVVNVTSLREKVRVQLNNATFLDISAPGDFSFATKVPVNTSYSVSLLEPATLQSCLVQNGSGVATLVSHVVNLRCGPRSGDTLLATAIPWDKQARVEWNDVGADSYAIYYSNDRKITKDNYAQIEGAVYLPASSMPTLVTGLLNRVPHYFVVEAIFPGFPSLTSTTTARPNAVGFDGAVSSMAKGNDDTLYVGGQFHRYGLSMEQFAAIPVAATTEKDYLSAMAPQTDGTIYVVISDGVGGYFIGGSFTLVDGYPRRNIAHILGDGSVDLAWNVSTNGQVSAMELIDGVLYFGGYFSIVNDAARLYLAAVDNKGGLVANFDPQFDYAVTTLTSYNKVLYVGGMFTSAANKFSFNGLAGIDLATNAFFPWSPILSSGQSAGNVSKLVVVDQQLVVFGAFDFIDDWSRLNLAAYNISTATSPSFDVNFNPQFDLNSIYTIASNGRTLFVGGSFQFVNGKIARSGLAAFDASGTLLNWQPSLNASSNGVTSVTAIAARNNTVYIAGGFETINGTPRSEVAAITADTGELLSWYPCFSRSVQTLATDGRLVFAAGYFTHMGGVERHGLAAIDSTGKITDWNPGAGSDIFDIDDIAVSSNRVYFAGDFTQIGGKPQSRIAAVDKAGILQNYAPALSGAVSTIALTPSRVVLGGYFPIAVTQGVNYLVETDLDGNLSAWQPKLNSSVSDIVAVGETLYIGGYFTQINGQSRPYLVAVDSNRDLTAFTPYLDGGVSKIHLDGDILYAAGSFSQISFTPLPVRLVKPSAIPLLDTSGLAALDLTQNAVLNWVPPVDGSGVRTMASSTSGIYLGGYFGFQTEQPPTYIAAVDHDGNALPWAMPFLSNCDCTPVQDMIFVGNNLYIGGSFSDLNQGQSELTHLARFDAAGNRLDNPMTLPPWQQ